MTTISMTKTTTITTTTMTMASNAKGAVVGKQGGRAVLDKPVSQKLPIARCYSTYVMNGNTPHHTLCDEEY